MEKTPDILTRYSLNISQKAEHDACGQVGEELTYEKEFKCFAERENSGLEEFSSSFQSSFNFGLERIFCNVFTLASCAKVISCYQKPQHLETPVNAEEDWNSTVEDADAGAPGISRNWVIQIHREKTRT